MVVACNDCVNGLITTMYVYSCSCLLRLYAVGFVRTDVQVFVGRALFERTGRRFLRMDYMGPVLGLVLGYWESSVVGPVYNRDCQGFQHLASLQNVFIFIFESSSFLLIKRLYMWRRS